MKTILVSGASGFVGRHTLNWLSRQEGVHLIAACRNPNRLDPGFNGELRVGDVRDDGYLRDLFDGVDVLVNALAWTSLFGHADESERLFYKPTIRLIDEFLQSGAGRIVNISTTSAAAPQHGHNALARGIERPFWPHLNNVIRIEEYLRANATADKCAVNLRLGIFVGEHYNLGLLPILLPRLKTHLVPWVAGGGTELPLTDGRDLGQAMGRAAITEGLTGYQSFNIVGKDVPTVRELFLHLHHKYGYPKPHFGVPFALAYPFAWLMERLDPIVPWEPLIVRSIIHLLENTGADNQRAAEFLGYAPQHHWQEAVRLQIAEMERSQRGAMRMAIDSS